MTFSSKTYMTEQTIIVVNVFSWLFGAANLHHSVPISLRTHLLARDYAT